MAKDSTAASLTRQVEYEVGRSREEPWWQAGFGRRKLAPEIRAWLTQYCDIPDEQLEGHLLMIREKAWIYHKYPCVGSWFFLLPILSTVPGYHDVISQALKSPHFDSTNPFTVLDLGCCFGQDLRRLASEGLRPNSPSIKFVATDLYRELWDLGFQLFRDEQSFPATFKQMNWLEPTIENQGFVQDSLSGKTDLILACQFLHLFSWEQQKITIKRIIECSRIGTAVIGYQIGSDEPKEVPLQWGSMYFHDATTFEKVWLEVAQETSTTWHVRAELDRLTAWGIDEEDFQWMGPDKRSVRFCCERIAPSSQHL